MQTFEQFFLARDPSWPILDTTLRVYILRLLLISSVTCCICQVMAIVQYGSPSDDFGYFIVPFCFSAAVIIHHVLSVFAILPVTADMVVTFFEVDFVCIVMQPWNFYFDQYADAIVIIFAICLYVQAICLAFLFLIRLCDLLQRVYQTRYETSTKSASPAERPRPRSRIFLVIGRSVLRKLFDNESRTIVVLRGVSAIAIIVGLLAFAVTKVILEPIHEAGWAPTKLFSSEAVPQNLRLAADSSWKIIVFIQIDEYAAVDDIELNPGFLDHIMQNFQDAVDVKPLWGGSSQNGPDCDRTSFRRLETNTRAALKPKIAGIEIHCPSRLQKSPEQLSFNHFVDQPSKDIWPDLLVRVNFPALSPLELIDNFFDSFNARSSTVYVAVGLTTDRDDILANTIPIPLVSNAHLLGAVQVIIRQQFGEDNIASKLFGPPASSFFVAQIPYLLPDPSITSSGNDDTATLRLYMQADASLWRFESDYRDKSVWAGLSALGGFWTSLNGFFIWLFGASLLRLLFDTKPLSTFGMLHRFKGVRLGEYPGVSSNDETKSPGLIAYLRDHFIDLSPVIAAPAIAAPAIAAPAIPVPASGGEEHELASLGGYEAKDV